MSVPQIFYIVAVALLFLASLGVLASSPVMLGWLGLASWCLGGLIEQRRVRPT